MDGFREAGALETDWISVVIWNKERLAEYLTKGSKVYVEGRLQTRSYEDKEGVKRYVTEVIAQNVILLGSNGNGNGAEHPKPGKPVGSVRNAAPKQEEISDWDVPF